ncbi:uncharacterized protein CC84DRAFT_1258657 [Paraphaeosphaeria sporulosa]|uniref:Extracellular membrane protein CFEM domain-containing protein n=1 Tax=Paraphaeosphaeria sporulosa TaxID=1460663 RepID=A0A177CJ98_9PLEO|nr:uncharacterized protein CC84DRAFT_1258657 [Paraphaeosphaeria sporulosa]OAG07595.1 hypothetical protein CC84DRAFT_1258657 [Paraphaeosphaeria sporulosa]
MFSKTLFAIAFAAVASVASAASPPGCLLGAVNSYDTPSDIKAVCSAKDITSQISQNCGDKAQDALNALADICNDAGVKVSTKLPTTASSGTAAPTGTGSSSKSSGSAQSTGSASQSGSGTTENSSSGTATGAPAENTGAAGALEVSTAALLAGLGIFAAAL